MCHLVAVLAFLGVAATLVTAVETSSAYSRSTISTCQGIANAVSSASSVYYPGTSEDVGIILQILGENRTPFAIKGGGHIMNPGFSSTTGVQISMSRFRHVDYDPSSQTATIGAGLVWDDVYSALDRYNVNVVGGRNSGVGVAGLALGGGYSWLTNQYGLVLDTIQMFQLVLPDGSVTNVTQSSDPDLFFGLKGGYNNFGVVTAFTLQTHPQGQVWGGTIIYPNSSIKDVSAATVAFTTNVTDPKAAIITYYGYDEGNASFIIASVDIFYDAPTPPDRIFDDFLAIPSLESNVQTRSFLSLVQAVTTAMPATFRGYFDTVPLADVTSDFLDAVVAESEYWSKQLVSDSELLIVYGIEPFLPDILTHGGPSAYPWTRAQRYQPTNVIFIWSNPAYDDDFANAAIQTTARLKSAAAQGANVDDAGIPSYPNYAFETTPVSQIWGSALPTLTYLKQVYDPDNVMSLAGGWKVPT
ncbi:hypothetical protein POSPLADRAFT_1152722 [Postia placenta MAD-698-R-SB12]|uniref:FAD-binding PCMH-type domain-containing protein n=1 Tax=Postia placenta MAD-698-R-SB12 TaxID=670580 RepID=A0A1X6MQ41_9APHY|nr:hypothetical protein POSPLADRAFT_1152722 [Postia placenta MAD-698-R-SB12]OSX58521.1 hypothetical protein POSPLADRAFT_1152722 [Postia placenta MAD-698-R-SB12]